MDSRFKIYSASAGSGKTFNLALEYLTLCLKGHEYTFREILALTFTNKAADEMKSRILSNLYKLSVNDSTQSFESFRTALLDKTGIPEDKIADIAKKALFAILHDFSAFQVITIDKFFIKVFRSFSADLLISSSRKPSIDQKLIEDLALDEVLSRLGINHEFTNFFEDYLKKQFSDPDYNGSSPVGKLKDLFQKISKDTSYQLLQSLENISYEDFRNKIERLRDKKRELLNAVNDLNGRVKAIFENKNIDRSHCDRGTLYDLYFEKLTTQPIDISKSISTLENVLKKDWHANFNKKGLKLEFIIDEIENPVKNVSEEILTNLLEIQFIDDIISLSSLLILLRHADQSIIKLSDEENLILLSDISRIIFEQIRKESGDFIYEKIGNRFKHIFIDEFQDTSRRQWDNMYPLVSNALSIDGSVKLIGDPKQSIYRFRNADSEQMLQLMNSTYDKKYPILPKKVTLQKNFRSAKNIVEFNNKIFTYTRKQLEHFSSIFQSFEDVEQQFTSDKEGLVVVKKLNKEQYEENTILHIADIIQSKVDQGFQLSDIAILTQRKDRGMDIANSLAGYQLKDGRLIEVTSSESFLINENPIIKILINTLRVLEKMDNQSASFELLYDLLRLGMVKNVDSEHEILRDFVENYDNIFSYFKDKKSFFPFADSTILDFNKMYLLRKFGVDELTKKLIELYNFQQEDNAFLSAFVDLIYDYCNSYNKNDISSFLQYWDSISSENISVNTVSTPNAIQIMTIHKSKGLEWPVVILPFFDFKTFKSDEEIIELDEKKYDLKAALIKVKKDDKWPHKYEHIRKKYIEQQMADYINLMYVAMTRAQEEMYISIKNAPDADEISNFLLQGISAGYREAFVEDTFSIGTPSMRTHRPIALPNTQTATTKTTDWRKALTIAPVYSSQNSEKLAFGSKIHALIASCRSVHDFQKNLERLSESDSAYKPFKNLTETIHQSPELQAFYNSENVLNERKILVNGQYFVPDSMAIHGNKISILEYKTGSKKSEHIHQLKTYMRLASEAGYSIDSGYLIYVNDENVEFEKVLHS